MKIICPSCGSQRVWPDIRDGAIKYRCKDCLYSNNPLEWDRGQKEERKEKDHEQRKEHEARRGSPAH